MVTLPQPYPINSFAIRTNRFWMWTQRSYLIAHHRSKRCVAIHWKHSASNCKTNSFAVKYVVTQNSVHTHHNTRKSHSFISIGCTVLFHRIGMNHTSLCVWHFNLRISVKWTLLLPRIWYGVHGLCVRMCHCSQLNYHTNAALVCDTLRFIPTKIQWMSHVNRLDDQKVDEKRRNM